MLELTQAECQKCRDVPRLCAAVAVLCQLIACDKPTGTDALQHLIHLTESRYPKVVYLLQSTTSLIRGCTEKVKQT